MNCKNRRNERAAPNRTSHLSQDEKKQNDGGGVENDIGKMKRAGIEAVELEIEHERDVLERKPVRGGPMSERPFDAVQREAGVYLRNFVDVFGIVEIDERKLDCLLKHEPDEPDKPGADAGDEPTFGNFIAHFADWDRGVACGARKDRHPRGSEWRDHARPEHSPAPMRVAQFRSLSRIGLLARKQPRGFE